LLKNFDKGKFYFCKKQTKVQKTEN